MASLDEEWNVDKEQLAKAARAIFPAGRMFRNQLQLAQLASFFASKWGFVSAINLRDCRCNCAESNSDKYKSTASPNSKRKSSESMKAVKCTYVINK
jgi:hypothetical protein